MTLAIYCAGGLGKEVVALCRGVSRWENIIFVDDVTSDEWYQGAKVFRFDEVKDFPDEVEFIIANGEPAAREMLYQKIKGAGYRMATVISPACAVFPGAKIGEGCILWDCSVSADSEIKPNSMIFPVTGIGHDSVVGQSCVISTRCFIGGKVKIGDQVYIASGSLVKDRISIGSNSIIGLGAVILRYVRPRAIMMGNPAKRIGVNTENKVFDMFKLR